MRKLIIICVVMALMAASPRTLLAAPTLINFDDATHMEVVNNKYAALGIIFIGMSGGNMYAYADGSMYPGHSPVSDPQMAYSDNTGIRMDFATPVVSLSLYGCDYGGALPGGSLPGDNEIATLAAYDSGGILLGSTTVQSTRGTKVVGSLTIPTDIAFLSLSGLGNIAYAEFTFTNGSFFGIDDVNFLPIPAPGAILLGSIGVGIVGWLRRRRAL